MAKFTLNIETDDVQELREIVGNIAGGVSATAPVAAAAPAAPEPAPTIVVVEAPAPVEKPKAATKAKKAEATPLSSSPAQDASKLPTDAATESNTTAATATTSGANTSLTPPAPASTVTYDQVKEALISLMDVKSASAVQALLKDKFGVVAISQLPKEKLGEALEAWQTWVAEA